MSTTDIRAAFEAHIQKECRNDYERNLIVQRFDSKPEEYRLEQVQSRWKTWQAATEAAKAEQTEFKGWYCAHCQRGVDASEVTFHEQHTVCGRFITDDYPPEATAQAQDLSAAILAIPLPTPSSIADFHISAMLDVCIGDPVYSQFKMRDLLKAAAALASSANALSAGDRVDLENWNTQMAGVKALLECTDGELECIGEGPLNAYIEHVKRIYAAILQSQKGGSHG